MQEYNQMSIGHETRHWKENFQGNSVWFKPEMRLKRTLKFGKKSFVESFTQNFLHEVVKAWEATWQAINKFKNKNRVAKGGKVSKSDVLSQVKKICLFFFFLGNISFGFKPFM